MGEDCQRFLALDSVKDGLNWYVYCGNNPIMYIDPLGLTIVALREWFDNKLKYITESYKNAGGSLIWNGASMSASVAMWANGYKGYTNFIDGVNGTYIKNDRMYVEESLLWQEFRNVIDPPAIVKSNKEIVIEKLEEIPIVNYFEASMRHTDNNL